MQAFYNKAKKNQRETLQGLYTRVSEIYGTRRFILVAGGLAPTRATKAGCAAPPPRSQHPSTWAANLEGWVSPRPQAPPSFHSLTRIPETKN